MAAGGPGKDERLREWLETYGPAAGFLVAALAAWQAAATALNIPAWFIPSPWVILRAFATTKFLWQHTYITLVEALSGFAVSAVLGTLTAAAIAHSRFLERGVFPYISLASSIPIAATAPLLVIWLGHNLMPKIALAMIITFFPIVANTARGLISADYRMIRMMRALNASEWTIFKKIQVPTALPYMFAGFKVSTSLCLIGAVVGEFFGGDLGLGYLLVLAEAGMETPVVFVVIFILAAAGILMFQAVAFLEKRLVFWSRQDVADQR
ncbi:MAG: ABC transporter permease [Candidatus Tectomicrobia bacterium]|nr:ABC transporter permease [Candidatus Tectomicrobia bacterium]